jgi:hypothetical protein
MVGALAFVSSAGGASAATGAIQLPGAAAATFTARPPDYLVGYGVSGAGDVNGDGVADLLIGAPEAGHNRRAYSGSAYVVFGRPAFEPRLPLAALGERGFRIDGAPPALKVQTTDVLGEPSGTLTDHAGFHVAAAGDVNGDGLGDVAVGAPGASANRRAGSGAAYVVYGKKTTEPVDLKRLGEGGYRIDGPRPGAEAGIRIAGVSDANGDGRGDLLVGTWTRSLGGTSGGVYLVFGAARSASVDLAHLGSEGIAFPPGKPDTGPWLDGLGDVNGDGLADVVIGAPSLRSNGTGKAFVVYGRATPGRIALSSLGGADGYAIVGPGETGFPVAGPGDVNGDGRPDVLVGGNLATHVLFSDGSGATVDLGSTATRSRELRLLRDTGITAGAGTGDANGDGLADVLLADPFATPGCHARAGSASVVYGRRQAGTESLANLGAGGYRVDGPAPDAQAGSGVAWTGDLNGDGGSDLLLGADGAGPSGQAYLVPGQREAVPARPREACMRITVPSQRLGQVARRGGVRATIEWRSFGEIRVTASAKGHPAVAAEGVNFRRAGRRDVLIRLTPGGRRLLPGRTRLRLKIVVETLDLPSALARTTVVLHR